jgi:hypothetical protein
MRTSILYTVFASVLIAAGPAPAKGTNPRTATCDAKFYDYLVGKNLDEARDVSGTSNYRVLSQGVDPGAPQPKRMTLTVDKRNQIVDVACS